MSEAVPATHEDALTSLRAQVPDRCYRFAEALAADPEMRLEHAAQVVGAPGQGTEIMRDPRTSRVLAAIMGADRDAMRDQRRAGIMMLAMLCAYDPAGAFDVMGRPLGIHEIPAIVRLAIESYETKADGTVRIRFVRRLDALRLLFQHFADVDTKALAVGGFAHVHFHGRDAI